MKLPFLDRVEEQKKLKRLLSNANPTLSIFYGRRRCGKSRLLQQLDPRHTVYYLADQSDQALQRQAIAAQLSRLLPGFDAATYQSWNALFDAVNSRNPTYAGKPITVVIDEFPNLLAESPALPGLIQKMIDTNAVRFHLVLCGSSQRMMKGLAFDETAPLYGRAREVIKIRPLMPGWIVDAHGVRGSEAVARYAVWGGVPRYWELAAEFPEHDTAIKELALNRDGILHNEPRRLLLDDMRTDTQPHSLLAVIGSGVHRISEICARLQKPAMNLIRPLEILIELGLVRRETPFGEPEKNSKRTLYTIADPFLRFWYRYVFPNLSAIEQEIYINVLAQWNATRNQHIGSVWEDLARDSVPRLSLNGIQWKQAHRWWGKTRSGKSLEIDVVAESSDGTAILIGEVKWGAINAESWRKKLEGIAADLPFTSKKRIVAACWLGQISEVTHHRLIITPEKALKVLR